MICKLFRGRFGKCPKIDLTQLEKLFVLLMVISAVMLVALVNYQEDRTIIISNLEGYINLNYSRQEDPESKSDYNSQEDPESKSDYNSQEDPESKSDEGLMSINKQNTTTKSIIQLPIKNSIQNNITVYHTILGEQKLLTQKHEDKKASKVASKKYIMTSNSSKSERESNPKPMISVSRILIHDNDTCLPVSQHLHIPKVDLQECSSPHVIIHDGGQLGNKMCQYISLYLLRHIYGIRVSITEKMKTTLDLFFKNITLPVQDPKCFTKNTKRIMYNDLYMMLHSRVYDDGSTWPSLLKESYYIFHHPCPREVITQHRDVVRQVLVFQDHVLHKAERNIRRALKYLNKVREDVTLITVHVRRRDYTQYIKKHYNLTALDEVYFRRAFDFYRERIKNPVFVILSDDHPWCRKVLETNDVVVAGSRKNPIIDIAILSLGDYSIISYGTFSFMGAILGRNTIVHPVNDNKLYDHYNCVGAPLFQPISRDPNGT